jgi:hypothetical protein
MKTNALLIACLALSLAACATMEWPQETFGSPGSYTKTVKVEPPADTCDPNGYIDGYRSGYMLAWNRAIADKMDAYRAAARQNPPDAKAKAAYDFYSGKLFDLQSVNQKETRYGYVPPSIECEFHSYSVGKGRGEKNAARDVDALQLPAPK